MLSFWLNSLNCLTGILFTEKANYRFFLRKTLDKFGYAVYNSIVQIFLYC